jgi:hypothetical protein
MNNYYIFGANYRYGEFMMKRITTINGLKPE